MTSEESKMTSLIKFFRQKYNLDILLEFVEKNKKRNKLSLRLIDWFVTNYSKQYGTSYKIKKTNGRIVNFVVWEEYQTESSSDGKGYFDPFRRGKKDGKLIELEYPLGKLETTIGQLTFFRWVIKNGVIDYVREHVEEIYEDMCQRGSNAKCRIGTKNGKRKQLSVSMSRTLGQHKVTVNVSIKNKQPVVA